MWPIKFSQHDIILEENLPRNSFKLVFGDALVGGCSGSSNGRCAGCPGNAGTYPCI